MTRLICALGALLMLGGCAGQGPSAVYTQAGVANPDPAVTQYPNANPLDNFRIAAQVAQNSPSGAHYQDFMRSGFALVYIRCNEYFDNKGTAQANANLLRDSIAPLTGVVSGLFALHTYTDVAKANHDIALLNLGTTTAIAGLDIYSQNFLFGADNIESVRTMVNEELNAHATTALALEPRSIEEAALQITDNQRICIPSHILASTRVAISKGRFHAAVTGGGGAIGSDLLTELGTALNLTPPTITETQAGLLFATTAGFARSPADIKFVRAKLAGLPDSANPIGDDGAGNLAIRQDFPFARLKQIFDAAPAATRLALIGQARTIMDAASRSAQADANAIARSGGMRAFLAGQGDPDANLRSFVASPSSEFSLPPSSPQALRRVRVDAD